MVFQDLLNETFVQNRHGIKTVVILKEIRSRKVVLQNPGRVDTFTMGTAEFQKKFQHDPTAKEEILDVRE